MKTGPEKPRCRIRGLERGMDLEQKDILIDIKSLRKVYKLGHEKVVALDDINLSIRRGEICCILGTSGSGKSTLLNMMAGLEKPSRGQILIGGKDIVRFGEQRLALFRQKNVGFVFQSYNLMGSSTALENVAMPLMFRGMDKDQRERIAHQVLREVGLGNRAGHRPTQMSGGQQQRVGIARAFVSRPKIVFADEPTGNLDSKTTIEVMELMVNKSRENNQTLILVTHDNEIAEYADRIVTLVDGRIISDVNNVSKARTRQEIEQEALAAAKAETAAAPGGQDGILPEDRAEEGRTTDE